MRPRKKSGLEELEFEPDIALYHKMGLGYQWRPKPVPEWYNQIPSVKRSNERQLERERQFDKAAGVAPEPNPDVKAQKRDELLLSSWLNLELPPRDYLLGSIMSTTSRWIVYGETGVGKTLFAMDMAGRLRLGVGFWTGRAAASGAASCTSMASFPQRRSRSAWKSLRASTGRRSSYMVIAVTFLATGRCRR
jgi:AAA domain